MSKTHARSTFGRTVEGFWLPVLLFALWWWASAGSQSIYFPPLATIVSLTWADLVRGPLPGFILFSLGNLAAGLGLATAVGIALGLLLGWMPAVHRVVDPLLQFFRAMPKVALVPLFIGALGIGALPKVYSIALGCVWPILLNTIDGVRGVEPGQLDMARAYRIPLALRIRRVVLPAAAPQIVAGVRVALSVGVVVMVVSEIYGSQQGMGYYVLNASRAFDVPQTWGGTLLIGLVGYALSTTFVLAERWFLRWHFARAQLLGQSA
ncbi:MAG: ABC transporter permease [Variovorax sp.]|nr:ABC transporter permease [Variovorax sp.]